jgi:hypothetical protein
MNIDYGGPTHADLEVLVKIFQDKNRNFWLQQIKDGLMEPTFTKTIDKPPVRTRISAKNNLICARMNYDYYNYALLNKNLIKIRHTRPIVNKHVGFDSAENPFTHLITTFEPTVAWEDKDCMKMNLKEHMVENVPYKLPSAQFELRKWMQYFGDYSYTNNNIKDVDIGVTKNTQYNNIKKGFLTKIVLP